MLAPTDAGSLAYAQRVYHNIFRISATTFPYRQELMRYTKALPKFFSQECLDALWDRTGYLSLS